jgi:hypothetical protein
MSRYRRNVITEHNIRESRRENVITMRFKQLTIKTHKVQYVANLFDIS